MALPTAKASTEFAVNLPKVFLEGITYDLTVSSLSTSTAESLHPSPLLRIDNYLYTPSPAKGGWVFSKVSVASTDSAVASLEVAGQVFQQATVPVIPAWASILPPLVAIVMALLIRSVLPALMFGLWLGAWALEGLTVKGVFTGLFTSFEVYVANAVADYDHATIMLFTFMIAGMVGVISRNGGMRGI